ncbi:MAG: glycoside hydrolase, partial [Deltaproteobacteria bacterium]|nr:glycoside hydrolase [Deltaproteobacteria bacterium]
VLLRSLKDPNRARDLPRTWEAQAGSGSIRMLFRDRGLSDLIGFTYARSPARDAVGDFLSHLGRIGAGSPQEIPTVGVFLDGENPWEHYPNSGRDFLRGLYSALERQENGVEPVTLGEAFAKSPPTRRIERIHSGSWIEANYRIWISHPEDNLGWTLLGEARRLLAQKQAAGFDPIKCRDARDSLLVAEGSDWFWWYGDDFSTDSLAEFDALFRGYVRKAFTLLGEQPPERLAEPIARKVRAAQPNAGLREPDVLIHPPLDGRASAYYAWAGAAAYSPQGDRGSMHQGQGAFSALRYGFDLERLYLRLDPAGSIDELAGQVSGLELEILREGAEQTVQVPLGRGALRPQVDGRVLGEGALNEVLTFAVRFDALGLRPGERAGLVVRALRNGVEVERLPRSGSLRFTVPRPDFEQVHWRV